MSADLVLLPRADRRVRLGHAWVFSNEIDVAKTPLAQFGAGDLTVVRDSYRKRVGLAYVNPSALICARVLTTDVRAQINQAWWTTRLRRSFALRDSIYPTPHYRAVYGESDGCPGLVVDRYGDVLVVQLNTAGIVRMREPIVAALQQLTGARGMLLRSAGSVRQIEGIEAFDETVGDVPEYGEVVEDESAFEAPLRAGQKTGYFYDQRDNRTRLARYVRGKSVLDVYSYIGSWGVRAARFGASAVTCIDSSPLAVQAVRANALRNGVTVDAIEADAIPTLESYAAQGRSFDVVVVDPPALIKRKKDAAAGQRHYERLNAAAMRVLAKNGVLISCSCSHHLEPAMLQRAILGAANATNRRAQILEKHAHAPDHPIHPAMPETEYLKTFFVRV